MSARTEALIAEARRYIGVVENPLGSNRGLLIDAWLHESGVAPGNPWCAAFAGQVGRQAVGAAWPCPRTASVQAIAAWAASHDHIRTTPEPGDLFLLWFPSLGRFAHVGIVTDVRPDGSYGTIEGNSNPGGSRDGWGVFARVRVPVGTTRFVRWEAALDD